jgi:hypothetical protein
MIFESLPVSSSKIPQILIFFTPDLPQTDEIHTPQSPDVLGAYLLYDSDTVCLQATKVKADEQISSYQLRNEVQPIPWSEPGDRLFNVKLWRQFHPAARPDD